MSDDYKLVHINLSDTTLNKLENVRSKLDLLNRTTAIRYAIDLADIIADATANKGKIIIEEPHSSYLIKVPCGRSNG